MAIHTKLLFFCACMAVLFADTPRTLEDISNKLDQLDTEVQIKNDETQILKSQVIQLNATLNNQVAKNAELEKRVEELEAL